MVVFLKAHVKEYQDSAHQGLWRRRCDCRQLSRGSARR